MYKNLVIVESVKKASQIEKILGKDFVVKSCLGHIRDLSKKDLGIDVGSNYDLKYEIPTDKRKVVDELKKYAEKSENIWLASDEDREGEAIAWHLTQVLGLDVEKTKRIVFHSVTKSALLKSIENPRTVDLNLVNAQQARRVLDRLVGFELSPVLWRKVRPKLSAGRVQSVAVRMVVEREREIIEFKSTPFFRVVAEFYTEDNKKTLFKADVSHRFESEAEAREFLLACSHADFKILKIEDKPAKRKPAAPFTTPTLQQEAVRKLGMSGTQIMSVAQKLYEEGLITYMRTDSENLSQEALDMCKTQIISNYGAEYSTTRRYKTKAKGAQEAHEAIRPTEIERQIIEGTPAERKLYDLIWKRTVASQMSDAEIDRTIVTISGDGLKYNFSVTGEIIRFDGFMKLYTESKGDDAPSSESSSEARLPKMSEGDKLFAAGISATERFTQAPPRYDEGSLVGKLKDLGIGRPATYTPTITTIKNRGYVLERNSDGAKRDYLILTLKGSQIVAKTKSENYGKEKKKFAPTDIAMLVNDYLESQFKEILDYNFTADVEKEFDRIAEGEISWTQMIDNFYKPFHSLVEEAVETKITQTINSDKILGTDPTTGREVKARIGRYGPMVEIVSPVEGEKSKFAALKKNQLIESITLEEALELFALPRTVGQFEEDDVVVGIGRYGAYARHKGAFTSLAKTDDPYTVDLERCVELITTSREAKATANTPLKTFEEDAELLVKNGRYGPYIAYKAKNYRLPKGAVPENLTFEEAMNIVNTSKK